MMKNILKHILSVSVVCGMVISCSLKEEAILPDSGSDNATRLVRAYVENFSRHDVTTKASDEQERKINNLALMAFAIPADGTERVLITDPIYVEGEKLDFVINTTKIDAGEGEGQYISNIQSQEPPKYFGDFDGALDNCRIYIVANMNSLLEGNVTTESDLLDIQYTVLREGANIDALGLKLIDVPEGGFPMIGWADNVNLSPKSTSGAGSQTSLKISLKKLFAKINVKFFVQLDTENIPNGMDMVKTPYFAPDEWSVHNIPTQITVRDYEATSNPAAKVFSTPNFTSFNFSTEESMLNKRIENSTSGNEYFEISFYVPEYKVLPVNVPFSYPNNIDENSKQFYKPLLIDSDTTSEKYQTATYVRIKGRYSDHQGYISQVEYKLYLGQNQTDDFQIIRNQQLNNTAIIKGLTNHTNATEQTISVDHRVEIVSSGYSIAMERETLLDSHYEIRPMIISVQEGAVVVVKIPQDAKSWFGAEKDDEPLNANTDLYEAKGNRKFFTEGLIDELGTKTAAKEFVFRGPTENNDKVIDETSSRLWFYFDENVSNPYDASQPNSDSNKLYREGHVYVDYYESNAAYNNGNGTPTKADREFTFRQMNLWAIHADVNDYNIEYFEEYLYNYAADNQYGVTTDGMAWGLVGEPLSIKNPAVYIDKDDVGGWGEWLLGGLFGFSFQGILNELFSEIDEKYDFYLSRDNVSQSRDYAGIDFTREIVAEAGIDDNVLTLSGNAKSAVEYCYNKNKRNDKGEVEVIKWYLPAIDETEEILVDGFDYFDVFQSRYYWSSQPSFNKHNFNATSSSTSVSGAYYSDDTERARATIVTADGPAAESGVEGAIETVPFTVNVLSGSISKGTPTTSTQTAQAGNQLRDIPNRVRCAYAINGRPHVYGTYKVGISTSTNGSISDIYVTINKSDDPTKGNVMLSNYLHSTYKEIGYPQYARYDKSTGLLKILMNQVVGVEERSYFAGGDRTHSSVVYSGNTEINNGTLTLQYNFETSSFTVVGNNINLRTNYSTNNGYYIRSFTRAN